MISDRSQMKKETVTRSVSLLLSFVFILFAILQFNDPDPVFWTSIYGVVALVSFLHVIKRPNKQLALVVMIGIALIALFYIPGFLQWMSASDKSALFGKMVQDKPYIEETREFIGLLMAIGSVLYQYKRTP